MSWQKELENGVRSMDGLVQKLGLSPEEAARREEIAERFPMMITPYYLSLADTSDPDDPIARMCIPSTDEMDPDGEFDTSGEASNTKLEGLQHKYPPTVLLLSTNQCAMYCRHCFRKRLVGLSGDEIAEYISDMAQYVREHKEINNVLVSGGDAFLNSNGTIRKYLEEFSGIEHLNLLRFGSRTPVVLPQRITTDPELVDMLTEYGKKIQIYVVTQFNHPNELTSEAREAVHTLMRAGIVVKNQTVLLKGVNDRPEVLGKLLQETTAMGIIPYYVFQCRPVTGVHSQFQVPLHEAYRVVEDAKQMQSGQGKCFRYVLSHVTGKIEILGETGDGNMLFKYHQAKYEKDRGRIFTSKIGEGQCWLD